MDPKQLQPNEWSLDSVVIQCSDNMINEAGRKNRGKLLRDHPGTPRADLKRKGDRVANRPRELPRASGAIHTAATD